MQELLAVALGGSIGAVSRYLVTNYIFIRWHCHWPWATLEPLVAAAIDIFIFGESLTTAKILGMILILSSIFILNTAKNNVK